MARSRWVVRAFEDISPEGDKSEIAAWVSPWGEPASYAIFFRRVGRGIGRLEPMASEPEELVRYVNKRWRKMRGRTSQL